MMSSRKLLQGLVLTLALGLTSVLMVGIWKGKTMKEQRVVEESEPTEAEMKLTDMEYTEMQEGNRIWTLKASEANYFQDEQKTLLTSVLLTLFLKSGEEIYLKSQKGILFAGTRNIELTDSVEATLPQGYTLSTEKAFYNHEARTIQSESLIHLTGPDVDLQGKRWQFHIPEREGIIEGGVRATVVFLPPKSQPSQ
ncbi:hypothetical protein DAMNIGENAA_36310 [Desulforhabdus amnigena]|uniref:LPS export ABC transporter periplasmic protein LptC n=2 Tax=Desulforhabdus amnigena TaxID=40218 RepID=A0A9W6FWN1_9BACT|nr:hypothetical protein DAMNIGENAA_36310 [Desulforhabdus amnigena]